MSCQMCNRHDMTCNCNKIKELLQLQEVAIYKYETTSRINGVQYKILRYFKSRKCLHANYFEHEGEILLLNYNYAFDFPEYFLTEVKNRWFRPVPTAEIEELRKNGFIK